MVHDVFNYKLFAQNWLFMLSLKSFGQRIYVTQKIKLFPTYHIYSMFDFQCNSDLDAGKSLESGPFFSCLDILFVACRWHPLLERRINKKIAVCQCWESNSSCPH